MTDSLIPLKDMLVRANGCKSVIRLLGKESYHVIAGQTCERMAPQRSELGERDEEKVAFRQVRVRQLKLRSVEKYVVCSHDVYVEHPVAVVALLVAVGRGVVSCLNFMQIAKHLLWCLIGNHHDRHVGERVGGYKAPRFCLHYLGSLEPAELLLYGTQCATQVKLRVAEIGAYVEKITHKER